MYRAVVAAVIPTLLLVGWATSSVTAQAPSCLPTAARTLGPHAFPGLRRGPVQPVYTDAFEYAASYLPSQISAEADTLNRLGFVSATWQLYLGKKRNTRGDAGGVRTEQFGSPEQAQAELDRVVAEALRPGRTKQFSLATIPGSRGLRESPNKRRRSGFSVLHFTDGDYHYDVGRYVKRGGNGTAQVIHAATDLYNRVHGAQACP